MTTYPVIVIGGSGYVAGELLRLVAGHPNLDLGAAVSASQAGERLEESFPHLGPVFPETRFVSLEAALERLVDANHWLVLSAAPHGASAKILDALLTAAANAGVAATVVDASADFRFADPEQFATVYGQPHPARARLEQFTCGVPEHVGAVSTPHAAHPGCFATAMLLGIVPLVRAGICADTFYVSAITGSTGAGRTPRATTHHPFRQSNLFAYQALAHRHDPEVRALTRAATDRDITLRFVPQSGPFARGIHATIFAEMTPPFGADEVQAALRDFYAESPLVRVQNEPPRMKDVAGSNYAALSATVSGRTVVVCSVIDNLLKGAAGGAVQWANRLLGLPETAGLTAPAAGWI
jgi:N-acetyl-gamma-glutamyl-phosphate reductase common form